MHSIQVVHSLHAWEEGDETVIWAPLGSATPEGTARGNDEVCYFRC